MRKIIIIVEDNGSNKVILEGIFQTYEIMGLASQLEATARLQSLQDYSEQLKITVKDEDNESSDN